MNNEIVESVLFFILIPFFLLGGIAILCVDPVFQDWFEEKIYNIKMKRIRKKQEKNAKMWEEFYNNLNKKR